MHAESRCLQFRHRMDGPHHSHRRTLRNTHHPILIEIPPKCVRNSSPSPELPASNLHFAFSNPLTSAFFTITGSPFSASTIESTNLIPFAFTIVIPFFA